jgi:hypothetical protein
MPRRLACRSFLLVAAAVLGVSASAAAERVVAVARDFDGERVGKLPPLSHHTWHKDQARHADRYSRLEVVEDPGSGSPCLRIELSNSFPWGNRPEQRLATVGPDYLSPEVDAVRMRVKGVSGRLELRVGSPTVYFGHSDVTSESAVVDAAADAEWRTVEFSLHHGLSRNFRRARFGRASPVIYYTRWIQEPLYLVAVKGSAGTVLVDQIELVSRSEGKPFPEFTAEQVRRVATVADFEGPVSRFAAFTFFQEPIDLTRPEPYRVRPDWSPPKLLRVPTRYGDGRPREPAGGIATIEAAKYSLRFEHQGTEEVCFAGVRVDDTADANALVFDIWAEHAGDPTTVIDFLVYAAPGDLRESFPWNALKPPPAWRQKPDAFDYYLSEDRAPDASYALYHARRLIPTGRRTTVIVPMADFICAYGRNGAADLFQNQMPLTSDMLLAIGWTVPFGTRRAPSVIEFDEISLGQVPGEAEELRSYLQKAVR